MTGRPWRADPDTVTGTAVQHRVEIVLLRWEVLDFPEQPPVVTEQ